MIEKQHKFSRMIYGLGMAGLTGLVFMSTLSSPAYARVNSLDEFRRIPIQHNGRIKSVEVYARETIYFLTSKPRWDNQSAVEFLFRHLGQPKEFLEIPFIRLDHLKLKELLGVPLDKKYFSYSELKSSFLVLTAQANSAKIKRDNDESLTAIEQKAEMLYSRLVATQLLVTGEELKIIPSDASEAWESPYFSNDTLAKEFLALTQMYDGNADAKFQQQVRSWLDKIYERVDPPVIHKIRLENLYYRIKPFHYAWIFYIVSFLLLLIGPKAVIQKIAYLALGFGFLCHTGGIVLRVIILTRPPVSNMYESMVFMNWVLVLCAIIYFCIQRKDFVLKAGAITGALIMIYADLLPLDRSMDVLVPVLRSHYWLTLHVLTIVGSYGILGFAMAIGHRHLFLFALNKMPKDEGKTSANIIYRLIQAGVLTLGAGTVLGGVWANESWGRFWGWDPKETWSLITFLGYMVIVHLRSKSKLNDFWLAFSAILGFLLVLMTWYGVNFLLGKGLHSYGSGSGGVQWFFYYILFEIAFFLFIVIRKPNRHKQTIF